MKLYLLIRVLLYGMIVCYKLEQQLQQSKHEAVVQEALQVQEEVV
ncbi:hypothetical protein [Pontibacter sp. 172403-2]|nr:hypothetical protein [Pontibacter sp. 172403-2]